MYRIALGISYEGSAFHGWQSQTDVPTIQGALEQAASKVANETISLAAAGRTDAGVHATGQVAAFSTNAEREPEQWRRGINTLTPSGIHVDWVRQVPEAFEPRFDAVSRRYLYLIDDALQASPLIRSLVWQVERRLDADLMHRAARALLGEHDFTGFRAAGCQSKTPWRRVNSCSVSRSGAYVVVDIEANAFLLHMVRNIVRGLVDASEKGAENWVAQILAGRDRTQLGPTAPPQGLYLVNVQYPEFEFPAGSTPPLLQALSSDLTSR